MVSEGMWDCSCCSMSYNSTLFYTHFYTHFNTCINLLTCEMKFTDLCHEQFRVSK